MRKINTDIWGTSYTVYDDMNIRTGTSAITDSDYTDYPPFVKNDLSSIGSDGNPDPTHFENDCIYIGYLNSPRLSNTGWNPSNELDLTVAYCACNNPDLLICNPIVLGVAPDEYTIDDNYNYTAPNQHKAISMERTGTKITPILFKNNETYARHRPNKSIYPLTGTEYIPYYALNSTSSHKANSEMNLWTPDGGISDNAGTETSSQRSAINNNAWISYWRDFGIRTIFGVIYVIYFDGTYGVSNGLPQNVVQNPVSLHWYETQTDAWKTGHPILGAYLDIYHRSNINGTYTSVKFNNRCFVGDILAGIEMSEKWGAHAGEYVWQPASCLRNDCNSFLPIFGPAALGARVDTAITGTVQIGTQLSNYPVSKDCEPLIGYMNHAMLHVGFRYSKSSMLPYKTFWLEMEGTAENLELLRKSAAAYGLFFADDVYDLADAGRDSSRWTDTNMCLGVVNKKGYTNGTYKKGAANTTANNFTWKTATQSPYNPRQFNIYIGEKQVENIYIGNQSIAAAFIGDQTL